MESRASRAACARAWPRGRWQHRPHLVAGAGRPPRVRSPGGGAGGRPKAAKATKAAKAPKAAKATKPKSQGRAPRRSCRRRAALVQSKSRFHGVLAPSTPHPRQPRPPREPVRWTWPRCPARQGPRRAQDTVPRRLHRHWRDHDREYLRERASVRPHPGGASRGDASGPRAPHHDRPDADVLRRCRR